LLEVFSKPVDDNYTSYTDYKISDVHHLGEVVEPAQLFGEDESHEMLEEERAVQDAEHLNDHECAVQGRTVILDCLIKFVTFIQQQIDLCQITRSHEDLPNF